MVSLIIVVERRQWRRRRLKGLRHRRSASAGIGIQCAYNGSNNMLEVGHFGEILCNAFIELASKIIILKLYSFTLGRF